VATAAHCVKEAQLSYLDQIYVGVERRRATHLALAPGWRNANGDNRLEDAAIIEIDKPVEGVTPVPLIAAGQEPPTQLRLIGRGRTSLSSPFPGGELREATLRTLSDTSCARYWRKARGNGAERFFPKQMICAIDADGRAPLSSGCNGDSGSAVFGGTVAEPTLVGMVSWGGDKCGADHLPSVSTEIARYRSFLLAEHPLWAPASTEPIGLTGRPRVGSRLSCVVPPLDPAPAKLTVFWQQQQTLNRFRPAKRLATGARYTVRASDAGHVVACRVSASNAAGPALIESLPIRNAVKIPK
jgi:hypothetical protein